MNSLRLASAAQRDLDAVFEASEAQFGEAAADRYRRLVSAALQDLRQNSARAGVRGLAGAPPDLRLYHLRHSRHRLRPFPSVARPRHVIAFRESGGEIVVLRILHDAMDLPRHLEGL